MPPICNSVEDTIVSDDRAKGAARQASGKVESTLGNLTGDTKTQAQGKVDDVAGQAQRSYGRAKGSVQDAAGQAQQAYGQARDTVRDAANQVSSGAGDYANSMLDQIEEYGDYIAEQVDQRPVTAVLIAAGVGFLIALITKPSPKVVYRRR